VAAPQSTYRQRGLTKHPEQRAQQLLSRTGDAAAMAMRQGNQQCHIFTICARSIAMLTHRLDTKDWQELQRKRMILSKPSTVKLVRLMMACKPAPSFKIMEGLSFHIFDQCYKKKGASRGEHRAAERVDASGDLVDLISMVIVNSITMVRTSTENFSFSAQGPLRVWVPKPRWLDRVSEGLIVYTCRKRRNF
jgi:hypothetical protein